MGEAQLRLLAGGLQGVTLAAYTAVFRYLLK
jgi:hypothetical protein